jgi:hypothetical protein
LKTSLDLDLVSWLLYRQESYLDVVELLILELLAITMQCFELNVMAVHVGTDNDRSMGLVLSQNIYMGRSSLLRLCLWSLADENEWCSLLVVSLLIFLMIDLCGFDSLLG